MFDDVRDLYSEAIRNHSRAPRHAGRPNVFDGSARGDNPMCGDRVTVFVRRGGTGLEGAGFEARGCELVTASADLMCDAVAGRGLDEITGIAGQVEAMARSGQMPDWVTQGCAHCDALEALQPLSAVHEFPSRLRCVTLPWTTLVAALGSDSKTSGDAA